MDFSNKSFMSKLNIVHLFIYSFILCLIPTNSFSDWQKNLESVFDIVETFDQLKDWHGSAKDYVTNTSDMPKKIDGSPSIWTMYSNTETPKADWIRNHGDGFVWNGTKSLCINYNNLNPNVADSNEILGYGPSRLGIFFGDGVTGKSGYKKINIFYMIKFRQGFFVRNSANDGWEYLNGYLKTLELCSGFTGIRRWGTDEDRLLACQTPQVLQEYGTNDTVFNIIGGGISLKKLLCFYDSTFTGSLTSNNCYQYTGKYAEYRLADTSGEYINDKWVGVEIIADIGTVNSYNGSLTINIYNDKGQKIGSDSRTNQLKVAIFDHYYNKITIGGNKSFAPPCGLENRFYIDDFIINKSEIAPTYFKMLSGECVPGVKLNKVTNSTIK